MIRIALDVDDLRNYILRSIAYGVNNHATAHRTVWTGTTSLSSTIDFQSLCLRIYGVETKTKRRDSCRPDDGCFEKCSPRNIHRMTSECELRLSKALTESVNARNRHTKCLSEQRYGVVKGTIEGF